MINIFFNFDFVFPTGRSCWRKRFDGTQDFVGEQTGREQVRFSLKKIQIKSTQKTLKGYYLKTRIKI